LQPCDEFVLLVRLRLAFPDHKHLPPETAQLALLSAITLDVALSLVLPERRARGGLHLSRATAMLVPETPMNKDHLAMPRQDNIRRSRQVTAMQVEVASTNDLRILVLSLDLIQNLLVVISD
jgi:hypothetical protein